MFGALKSLGRAAIGAVVQVPVAIVADTVTMGGLNTDRDEPYTATAVKKVMENIDKATDPEER